MEKSKSRLGEIARVFLRLGLTSFGGPAAHLAMMEEELVRRRGWITSEHFLDLISAAQFIPGPNSTEVAIHIGHVRGGWRGLIVAGTCFILPAALIVAALAALYVRGAETAIARELLHGIKPVMIAVIAQALWSLARSAIKSPALALLACLLLVASFFGVNEILLLCIGGLATSIGMDRRKIARLGFALPAFGAAVPLAGGLAGPTLAQIFLFFAKVGSVLFGSGYVLIAFLRQDLVESWHWLTESQLLDAIAIGQFTPGPVFTTATFIGFLLGGGWGAFWATLGIFLPAFVFVAATAPFLARLRSSERIRKVLDGVNVASLAVMASASVFLGRTAIVDVRTLLVCVVSFVLLTRLRVNSAWLVLAGGVLGLVGW